MILAGFGSDQLGLAVEGDPYRVYVDLYQLLQDALIQVSIHRNNLRISKKIEYFSHILVDNI